MLAQGTSLVPDILDGAAVRDGWLLIADLFGELLNPGITTTEAPRLSFQLVYDPDYPPPTYVTREEGAGSRGRCLI